MTLYICIFLFLILGFFIKGRNSKTKYLYVVFFVFAIITAIRDGIGTDYETYYYNYLHSRSIISKRGFIELINNGSFLFNFIQAILKEIGFKKPHFFFFIISLITSLVLFKTISNFKFKYPIEAWFIYFCFFFLNFQFNTIRHGIAASFIWLAFSYIPTKNIRKFFLFAFIGFLFHSIALFFIPFYWLLQIKINGRHLIFVLIAIAISVISPFIYTIVEKILNLSIPISSLARLEYYAYGFSSAYGKDVVSVSLGMMVYSFLVLIIFFLRKKYFQEIFGFNIFFNALLLSVVIYFVFSSIGILVERIGGILNLSLILLLPSLVHYIPKGKLVKALYFMIFIIYGALILNANMQKKESFSGEYQFINYKTIYSK